METINKNLFEYVPDKNLPILFLSKDNFHGLPNDKKIEGLEYVAHQTAGLGCHQHYLVGKTLTPKDKVLISMYKLEKEYLDSNCGLMNTSLDELISYRQRLNQLLTVDCNYSYSKFEEGIYPIDYSKASLEKLIKQKTIKDTKLFMKQIEKMNKFPIIHSWTIYILGQNSD